MIESIEADVGIATKISSKKTGSNSCSGTSLVPQKYSIKFLSENCKGKEGSEKCIKRSGNPGYILGLPVLVAGETGSTEETKMRVYYPDGFEIAGFN